MTERIGVRDLESRTGITFERLLAEDITFRFVAANTVYAIPHTLGVPPRFLTTSTQLQLGTPAAVYCEARPRDGRFIYMKCSVANTVCKIGLMG